MCAVSRSTRRILPTLYGRRRTSQRPRPGTIMRASLLLLIGLMCSGCTHRQLSRSIVNQASTIATVEYQMVLDNIAMYSSTPELLPWHVRISDGTVQVNDEGGISEFGVQWGSTPGFTQGFARCAA